MTTIRCMIIDDEPPARELMQRYCDMTPQIEVVAVCTSAIEAFDRLRTITVDLLFLDIQMPVLTGIDFIKTLQQPPAVILTTAYREYALDGYDLDIIDYLLKPIAFDRFLKAVDRYQSRMGESAATSPQLPVDDHLYVSVNRTKHKVILSDILYIESLKDYYRIHFADDRLVVKGNIGSVEKDLPTEAFIRIHRSYIVRRDAITSFSPSQIRIGTVELPIGSSYRKEVGVTLGGL